MTDGYTNGPLGEMAPGTETINRDESKCIGCVTCSKACPTRAIRVRQHRAVVQAELCIDCGECIRGCPRDAITAGISAPSDLKRFRYTIAIPSTAIYSQFGRGVYPEQVAGALLQLGFDAFYDVSWMCQMVGGAIDTFLSECGGPWPRISATCPAVVRLVMLRYPDLIPHLVPIKSPRELTAKLARRKAEANTGLSPEEIGVFYITPCSAIMRSIVSPVGVHESVLRWRLFRRGAVRAPVAGDQDGLPARARGELQPGWPPLGSDRR